MTHLNLHLHSHYSVGDALPTPEEISQKAPEGSVLALTDHNTLGGAVQHEKACREHGHKPIFGAELDMDNDSRLVFLVKNEQGWENLCRLVREVPVSWDNLVRYNDGLFCLTGDLKGVLCQPILRDDPGEFADRLHRLERIFGDRLYLEVIDHGLNEQEKVKEVFDEIGYPTVRTNDVHFLEQDDARAHAALICDKLDRRLDAAPVNHIDQAYLKDLPAGEHERHIANECDFRLNVDHEPILPDFEVEGDPAEFLFNKASEGFEDPEYIERLERELEVVKEMGYVGYYLIVWDFIKQAREMNIPIGPGRGSGAGSLLAYGLGITGVDPIEHDLLFERFLNPERLSMPDFDIDFGKDRRAEVIEYVRDKYGDESVAGIITYNKLQPRAAFKAACRVFGIDAARQDAVSEKYLPETRTGDSLEDCRKDGRIDELLEHNEDLDQVIDHAFGLEGIYRNEGRHPGGVVIADKPVWKYAPLKPYPDEELDSMVGFDMEDAEDVGLVKFDFLGLAELTVIRRCHEIGDNIPKEYPPGDDLTYDLFHEGHTLGVFQCSSDKFGYMLSRMKPNSLKDLAIAVALYRPGPMDAGMMEEYLERRRGYKDVEYLHEDLEDILEDTLGIIVFQEQVMQIAQEIAGYSLGEADILRRAMGKKKDKVMQSQKKDFLEGARTNGYDDELADEVWRQIETFSRYGFNRCLTGDTVLERAGANQYVDKQLTVKELYDAQYERDENGHLTSWAKKIRNGRQRILQYCPDGRIRPGYIVQVHQNGAQDVFKVELSNGNSVTATSDHRFLTDSDGYKEVSELDNSDCLIVRGEEEPDDNGRHSDKPSTTAEVESVSYEGEKMTYDVEMDDPYHNFMANGVVSHNSHATSYGKLAYNTAYLKANHTAPYMAAQMEVRLDDTDQLVRFKQEARRMGVTVHPPDITYPCAGFEVHNGEVYMSLAVVDHVTMDTAEEIKEKAPYDSIYDFIGRYEPNASVLESLCAAGALDSLFDQDKYERRTQIIHEGKKFKKAVKKYHEQQTLFDHRKAGIRLPDVESVDMMELYMLEKDKLGWYRTGHPTELVERVDRCRLEDARDLGEAEVWLTIDDVDTIWTKNGDQMAFLRVSDDTQLDEVTVFPDEFEEGKFEIEEPVKMRLTPNAYKGDINLIFQEFCHD